MWIFGYGSLIWNADFPYDSKLHGYINGFQRKFYQHSTDHRGTPENPGRVVTLLPGNEHSRVWGVAYKLREDDVDWVINQLDYREQGGYEKKRVMFFPKLAPSTPFEITVYQANMDNANYGGFADELSIAKQIIGATGSSGTNVEYICNLAQAMREIAPEVDDEHLFSTEEEVNRLLKIENFKS